jgi:hypothetical protein
MTIDQILAILIAVRNKLNQALKAPQGSTPRRGRPPRNSRAFVITAPRKKKRRTFTAAQRKQQGEKMRQFWAAKRAAEAESQRKAAKRTKRPA